MEDVAPAMKKADLHSDIQALRAPSNTALITQAKGYEVYLAAAKDLPHVLLEIGRLREITFRSIGEGTGLSRDLDPFDTYYHHLILWDTQQNNIAGAYRMGFGQEIMREHGIKGFYLRSLFKIKPEGRYLFREGLELGRAFVTEPYQMRPLPLYLMWKAIIHIVLTHPDIHYILGSVSISNRFSRTSKSLIVQYVKKYYFDAEYAEHVRPRKNFKPKLTPTAAEILTSSSLSDLKRIDKMIAQFEPDGIRFPVLLKKYLAQNARIVGFNVDPLFGHSLDGFMYINTKNLPEQTLRPVLDELEARAKAEPAG